MSKKMFLWVFVLFLSALSSEAQVDNWQNLDLKYDSVFGISTEKAYKTLLRGKSAVPVIVAVIDMGIDTSHEDLRSILWVNHGEIAGNGVDDDHNGFVDDVYGWNFTGYPYPWEDLLRITLSKKAYFDSLSLTKVPVDELNAYRANRKLLTSCREQQQMVGTMLTNLTLSSTILDIMVSKIAKPNPVLEDFVKYPATEELEKMVLKHVIAFLPRYKDFNDYKNEVIEKPLGILKDQVLGRLNVDYCDYDSINRQFPGDNDVNGPFYALPNIGPYHGTSVSAVIAADRNNNMGMKGVADHVVIMSLRSISFFQDMRDADIARAIRYAVDNGAKIINLSFEREYSADKEIVDAAVRYAMSKDVLIVAASGNDGLLIENESHFPNRHYIDGQGEAKAWINVAASGWKDDNSLPAGFSNYNKNIIDVFAPGVQVKTCIPGGGYKMGDGTSLAAPLVSGLAALLREYYPHLSAVDVKNIIMRTVVKRDILKEKCISGGVVNAYDALRLAETYNQ